MNMGEANQGQKSGVSPLVAMLVGIVGVGAIPQFTQSAKETSSKSEVAKKTGVASDSSSKQEKGDKNADLKILDPLVKFLGCVIPSNLGADNPVPENGTVKTEKGVAASKTTAKAASVTTSTNTINEIAKIKSHLCKLPIEKRPRISALVAAVAQPLHSSNSHRFDEMIEVIQHAAESQGFVLDRYRYPWVDAKDDPTEWTLGQRLNALVLKVNPPKESPSGDPGLLLFRRLNKSEKPERAELLLVFLVSESPVSGLEKRDLTKAFDLAIEFSTKLKTDNRPQVHLLGPNFTGSQPSLEIALEQWFSKPETKNCHVEIITGMATGIEPQRLINIGDADHKVTFTAAVHSNSTITATMINHLVSSGDVAMLVESNTGFGSGFDRPSGIPEEVGISTFEFPMHIAQLRDSYEKRGLITDSRTDLMKGTERLRLELDGFSDAGDLPPLQSPGYSVVKAEQLLNQSLSTIADGDFKAVGIIATDPTDVVFLVKRIRAICGEIRIFTVVGDSIFNHPQYVGDLRGLYIGSTYPLVNPTWNQKKDVSISPKKFAFSDDKMEGIYNATIMHLSSLNLLDPKLPSYVDYGSHRLDGELSISSEIPPVWITRAGYGEMDIDTFKSVDSDYIRHISSEFRPSLHASDEFWSAQSLTWWFLWGLMTCMAAYTARMNSTRRKGQRNSLYPLCCLILIIFTYFIFNWTLFNVLWRVSSLSPTIFVVVGIFVTLCLMIRMLYIFASRSLESIEHFNWVSRRKSPNTKEKIVWRILRVMIVLIFSAILFGFVWASKEKQPLGTLFQLKQATDLDCGLSPSFPIFFLALATTTMLTRSSRRQYFFEFGLVDMTGAHVQRDAKPSESGRSESSVQRNSDEDDVDILARLQSLRGSVEESIARPANLKRKVVGTRERLIILAYAISGLLIIKPWLRALTEGLLWTFDAIFWTLFLVLALAVARSLAELCWFWRQLSDVMRWLTQLPLSRAMDRLPSMISGWFLAPIRNDGLRSRLIRNAAVVLANSEYDFSKALPESEMKRIEADNQVQIDEWGSFDQKIKQDKITWNDLESVKFPFRKTLEWFWSTRPLGDNHPDPASNSEKRQERSGSQRIDRAEELLALMWLRWLSTCIAILWSDIVCTIIALAALMLSLTSYPFQGQGQALGMLALIAVVLTVVVLRIVLALSNNDMLSRVANSTKGLKFDQQTLTSLFYAVIPILGLIAAISSKSAYTLRTLLDPLFKLSQ